MAPATVDGRTICGSLQLDCDVVVVGSGTGGATAARIMAREGLNVVILEEGSRITPPEPAALRPSQSLRHLWREAGLSIAVVRRGLGREPIVTYRLAPQDRVATARGLAEASQTFVAAGAQELILPVVGLEPLSRDAAYAFDFDRLGARHLECTSQHPLGTCRISQDAARGVVSQDHETWEVQELFVLEGSVVPSSLGVNPQLTIMALANRAAQNLVERPLP